MKRSHRHRLYALATLATASTGCGPAHDRQDVYTVPRGARVQVDKKERARVRPPYVDVQVPAPRPEPPASKIDVPVIDPD